MTTIVWLGMFALLCGATLPLAGATTCVRDYKKIGCFKGTTAMTLLISDRDGKGIELNWKDLAGSLHSLACRCSQKAKEEGYQYFVIRFWAECWAGRSHATLEANVNNPSMASTECAPCNNADQNECVGKSEAEYAYSIAHWSGWQQWGACSKPCGGGKRQRRRVCNKIDNVVNECNGAGSEEENCNTDACPTCEWRANTMTSGTQKDMITDLSSKEECLSRCLWKRLSQPAIDGINYVATSPPECQCVHGASFVSSNNLVTYCKLKTGGFLGFSG